MRQLSKYSMQMRGCLQSLSHFPFGFFNLSQLSPSGDVWRLSIFVGSCSTLSTYVRLCRRENRRNNDRGAGPMIGRRVQSTSQKSIGRIRKIIASINGLLDKWGTNMGRMWDEWGTNRDIVIFHFDWYGFGRFKTNRYF